ncbi:hypothetical protein B0H19DRAFT_131541 [Mycena capillaripes]|nr:hypothetical protein B0H19DRAFT_131541 [Mycena capillaripes]
METDDIVLVHTIDIEPSAETKDKLKYAKQYPLVIPSYEAKSHDERRAAVVSYFAREPELKDGEQRAIALSKLVFTTLRENDGWIGDHVCSLCLDKRGGATIVLACPCRHEIYHRHCIQQWHYTNGVDNLVPCPTCRMLTKPVDVTARRRLAREIRSATL